MKVAMEAQAREKEEWRRERARLPFPEKIRILVELQKRQAPILAARGKKSIVWDIEDSGKA